MEVLHVISSLDVNSGGPSRSVSDLCNNLAQKNLQVHLVARQSPRNYLTKNQSSNFKLDLISNNKFRASLLSRFNSSSFDLLHGHALWQMPVHEMARWARLNHTQYLISPRGMLEPWALNHKKFKKKVALWAFQRKDLNAASCLHATAISEAVNIRKLGFENPVAVIPNGIELSEFPLKSFDHQSGKRTILFLSRIHPKKGIELLIEAWRNLDISLKAGWKVEITGNGEKSYLESLDRLIIKKGLADEICITGPRFGADKLSAFHGADVFVLPTYSENFGVVVAEALACGIPVITTKGAPWEELATRNAGWWIDIGTEPLVECLRTVLALPDEDLQRMGKNGRKLVEDNYSIESVAEKMIQLYKWILSKTQKPHFIY